MRSLVRILILLAAASVAGAVSAAWRGLPWVPDKVVVQKKLATLDKVGKRHKELREKVGISLDGLKAAMQQGVIILDARPREEFDAAHLEYNFNPPVLNIEPEKVGENLKRLSARAGQPVIIYCTSDECTLGEELYLALESYNLFFDVKIYFPGWEGLQAANMPTVSGPDTWAPAEAGDGGDASGGDPDGGGDGAGQP